MIQSALNVSANPGDLLAAAKLQSNVHHGWKPSVVDQTVLSVTPPVGGFSLYNVT
jgi:hypothetical protein